MNKWEKMRLKLKTYYPNETDSRLDEIVNELDLIANYADQESLDGYYETTR